ncbi:MAG: 5'/3'-nucleotidase SurE [Treponema sp.]|nr:5'/3'-nucleotidase SurE [Treponema sp.]
MNILISNDDGITAKGIQFLTCAIRQAGHTVFVFAPSRNRSAISNAITMCNSFSIECVGEKEWSYSGTPADCVIAAFRSGLIPEKIDAVFAGINDGANLGTDILYSGTCAVARQGALYNVPSVALSIDFSEVQSDEVCCDKASYYRRMADFAAKNIDALVALAKKMENRAFVNVNAFAVEKWRGARVAKCLARRCYCNDGVRIFEGDDGMLSAEFIGNNPETQNACESDFALCEEGFISVSCVQVEPNCYEVLDDFHFSL